MSRLETDSRTNDWLDPGPRIRHLVALMLRLALGVSLLNAGLARYSTWVPGVRPPGMVVLNPYDPFMTGLAYLKIGLGIALILGVFLTLATVGVCLVFMASPVYQTVMELANTGFGPGLNDPYLVGMNQILPMLMVPAVLMLWLSPVGNHPYSIDALIFARDRDARAIRPPMVVIPAGPATSAEGSTAPGHSSGG